MAQAFTASVDEKVTMSGGSNGLWVGANTELGDGKRFIGNGAGLNEAEDGHHSNRTLAGAADVDIDLQAELNGYGNAIALQSLVYLRIKASAANVGILEVKPSAAAGWFGALASFGLVTDSHKLPPGGKMLIELLEANAYTVSAGAKGINVLNLDGSNAGDFSVTIIGRK